MRSFTLLALLPALVAAAPLFGAAPDAPLSGDASLSGGGQLPTSAPSDGSLSQAASLSQAGPLPTSAGGGDSAAPLSASTGLSETPPACAPLSASASAPLNSSSQASNASATSASSGLSSTVATPSAGLGLDSPIPKRQFGAPGAASGAGAPGAGGGAPATGAPGAGAGSPATGAPGSAASVPAGNNPGGSNDNDLCSQPQYANLAFCNGGGGTGTGTGNSPSGSPNSASAGLAPQSSAATPGSNTNSTSASPNTSGKKGPDTLPLAGSTLTISQAPSPADIDGSSDMSKEVLQFHNEFRQMYGAGPLTWDADLARQAQEHANTCQWDHQLPQSRHLGNNIYKGWTSEPNKAWPAHTDLIGYAGEFKDYDWSNPRVTGEPDIGHFTQMVWKATTKVGCAWNLGCDPSTLSGGGGFASSIYQSCWYSPAGNNIDTADITANVGAYSGA